MRRAGWVGLAAAWALAMASGGRTAATGDPALAESIAQYDRLRQQVWQRVWHMEVGCAHTRRDLAGRSCSELLRQHVLPAAEVETLDQLRRDIDQQVAAARLDDARASVARAKQALNDDSGRKAAQFSAYMTATESLDLHRHLWQVAAAATEARERQRSASAVAAAEAAYAKELRTAPDLSAAIAHWPELRRLYQDERLRLSGMSRAMASVSMPGWKREAPCSPPLPLRGGTRVPSLAQPLADLGKFYPFLERRSYVEGRVVLEISVDAAGCLQSASIERSTGSPALDAAAIAFAAQASFQPAERDGVPIAASVSMPVNFSLTNSPAP